jgi:hypothetical protein
MKIDLHVSFFYEIFVSKQKLIAFAPEEEGNKRLKRRLIHSKKSTLAFFSFHDPC